MATHWCLDCIDDIVGVSVPASYGVSICVKGKTFFVSTHAPFARVVQSKHGSSTMSGSLLHACMKCGKPSVAEATIVHFSTETSFADRFII